MLESWPEYLARKAAEVEAEAPAVKKAKGVEDKAVKAVEPDEK